MTTLEQASIAIGLAVSTVALHDTILEKYMQTRCDWDVAIIRPPGESFSATHVSNALTEVLKDVKKYERRVVMSCKVENFEVFRRQVIRCQHMLSILGQYQDRMDTQQYMLDIYQASDSLPQNLKEEETFDRSSEITKMEELHKQYKVAMTIFIEAVSLVDIGEHSDIVLPDQMAIISR